MNDRERYQRIDDLFAAALELESGAARDDFLAEATAGLPDGAAVRAEVERLLDADAESDGFLEPDAPPTSGLRLRAGDTVGPYRLLELLGEGGMGVVWLAERADRQFERRVALKILPVETATPELVRRLRAERQFLAGLEHPHIARLYDGGTTDDGRPYLILEWVDGEPIDRYCAEGDLSRRECVALFVDVCAAVDHAHRRRLVHRDLKPANVLVTADGRVKLLDFGIAKLLDPDPSLGVSEETRWGLRPLTPAFASPEQRAGDPVGPPSDVYSLGLLLRRLLGGDETPLKGVGRDLAAVVEKALRRDPAERYPDAGALAEDLRRHLDGLPVAALRGRWRYRAGKWLTRHRAAAAAVLLLLLGTSGFATYTHQQQRALSTERELRDDTLTVLRRLIRQSDPTVNPGQEPSLSLLTEGARIVREDLEGHDALRAELGHQLAQTLVNLAHYDLAEEPLRLTLEAQERVHGPNAPELAQSWLLLAELHNFRSEWEAGLKAAGRAWEIVRSQPPREPVPPTRNPASGMIDPDPDAELFTRAAAIMAQLRLRLELYDATDDDRLRRAVRRLDGHPYAFLPIELQAQGRRSVGDLQGWRDLLAEALELLRYAQAEEFLPPGHPLVAKGAATLAAAELEIGHLEATESLLEESRGIYEATLEPDHPLWARWHMTRGGLAEARGEAPTAVEAYRTALEIRRSRLGEDHPRTRESAEAVGRLGESSKLSASAKPTTAPR